MLDTPSDKPNLRGWNWLPEKPAENSPLFSWPPRPAKIAAWFRASYLTLSIRTFILALALVSWLFLTPGPEVAKDLAPGWILALFARNLVMMLIVAGGLHLYFYTWRKQGTKRKFDKREMATNAPTFKFNDQILDNVYYSLVYGVTFWTLLEVGMLWVFANGYVATVSFSENPVWFLVLIFLIPIWHSLHFYWIHRFLHWKPVYDTVHAVHHKNVNIGPWSGMSMHPVESFIYLTSVLVHLVVISSPFHMIYHLQFMIFNAVIAHCGFESLLVKDKDAVHVGRFHHQMHHRYFECNYGNGEMPWDVWFGSFHDGTEPSHERFLARRRK
ncbi:MAG: sterol desaturase family protein [Hyphomicrobiaceae bacterium]